MDEHIIEGLVVGGLALAPLISTLISILKEWLKIPPDKIPLVNVLLGTIAVLLFGIFSSGLSLPASLIMTLGVVFGSQVFHETFGHAFKELQKVLGKKY